MRIPTFIRVLLYKLGIDSCDSCGWRLVRRDRWCSHGWDMWGPWLHCRACNEALERSYDAYMQKEMSRES